MSLQSVVEPRAVRMNQSSVGQAVVNTPCHQTRMICCDGAHFSPEHYGISSA
jgi:hypothetical protein